MSELADSLNRLDSMELAKLARSLDYHKQHPYDQQGLVLATSNIIELVDTLPKLNGFYTDDMVSPMLRATDAIRQTLEEEKDFNLKKLLQDALDISEKYLAQVFKDRTQKETPMYPKKVDKEPELKNSIKDITKYIINRDNRPNINDNEDGSNALSVIADGLTKLEGKPSPDEYLDVVIEEGLKRFKERMAEYKKTELNQRPELSLENMSAEEQLRQKVLMPLASRLLAEERNRHE